MPAARSPPWTPGLEAPLHGIRGRGLVLTVDCGNLGRTPSSLPGHGLRRVMLSRTVRVVATHTAAALLATGVMVEEPDSIVVLVGDDQPGGAATTTAGRGEVGDDTAQEGSPVPSSFGQVSMLVVSPPGVLRDPVDGSVGCRKARLGKRSFRLELDCEYWTPARNAATTMDGRVAD